MISNLLQAIKQFFFRNRKNIQLTQNIEQLRSEFKARYHSFKLLLSANNKALEVMADMEQALTMGRPFGMTFVRASSTAISVNVYQIIKNLLALAPNNYDELLERFKVINDSINQALLITALPVGESLVLSLEQIDKDFTDQVGGKMANVGELRNRVGLDVPDGFVITALAYRYFFDHNDLYAEINRRMQTTSLERMDQLFSLSSTIQQLIIHAEIPLELSKAIEVAYNNLQAKTHPKITVSMRSSALGEDGLGTSFAGQYRSQLNISSENLIQAYKEIVASKYSPQAISYRFNRGLRDEDVAMCVGCMAMVEAKCGGVIYSRSALNIRDDRIYINSAWGLPKSVVDGSTTVDTFIVNRSSRPCLVEAYIGAKERKFVCYPNEGVYCLDINDNNEMNQPSLTEKEVLELAQIALKLEEHYGIPLDIEWAICIYGRIRLLQCRPLSQGKSIICKYDTSTFLADTTLLTNGGVTASSGVAAGLVYWVRKDSDALMFPEGAVLVVAQSLPRYAALLSRAAAVVAAQGGVAGHLANVAREFGVPALFGLNSLEEKLKDGQEVTVDADGLAIYSGRIESLLTRPEKKTKLMANSPVYQTLVNVMSFISPLTLINPDSSDFKPVNCQTLHDITRFCHEKSVYEMFSFGKNHHFNERSAKQLYYKVAMQWWVINLDNGFIKDDSSKYVTLENIACVPMLALWDGMTMIPWDGPPPVNARGFASILFQATINKSLLPTIKSSYSNRNYFMISKNFMSLYSRFGFHFSTIETLISERVSENYASFSFKGGAANFERKLARIYFVANLLEEYNFRVDIKEDSVFARIENLDEKAMKNQLKILGYLIIHTRQLDMVMGQANTVAYFQTKMRKDLNKILNMSN